MTKRDRRTYTDEFKAQMVKLYESGKSKHEAGSFKEKDNLSPEELVKFMSL